MITLFYGYAWTSNEVTVELHDAMQYYDHALEWGRFGDDDQGIFLAVKSTITVEPEDTIRVPLLKLSVIPFRADEWNQLLGSFMEAADPSFGALGNPAWMVVWHESV